MTTSRDIRLNVIAETKRYQQEMAKVPGVTEKQAALAARRWEKEMHRAAVVSAKSQEKAAKDSAKAWDDFGTVLAANLSADAIKGAATALFDYTSAIFENRQEHINLADATGISLELLGGLQVAAERAGVPISEITGGFEDFGEVLFDAANGGGRATEALELLNFTQSDLNKGLKDTDGALREVLVRMSRVENAGKRNAIAQQLFGDAGNRLNAVLGDGTIEDYIAAAEDLGLVLDQEAVANTRAFTRATAELGQVVKGTAGEFVDFFEVGDKIEDFTLGFVAAKEFIDVLATESLAALGSQLKGVALILTGSFREGLAVFQEGVGFDVATDALANAKQAALDAAEALFTNREALGEVATTGQDTSKAIRDLTDNQKKLAKATDDTAKIEAKLNAERRKEHAAFVSAVEEANTIAADASSDRLTDLEAIALAENLQIARLNELGQIHGDNAVTAAAVAEVEARAARETGEVWEELYLNLSDAAVALDEQDAELKNAQKERNKRNADAALEGMSNLMGATDALLGMQLAAAQEAGDAVASTLDDQLAQREAISEAILASTDADEKASLERDARVLDSSIGVSEEILAMRQKQVKKLFAAQQALEIASILMSGATAAIAALAPPPVGAGPVFGPALAVTVGAAVAAQTAVVASQKAPQFHAGYSGGSDETPATLRAGESVNNQRATEEIFGGSSGVRDMNETGMRQGGQAPAMRPLSRRELGIFIVDEIDAGRELTQRMNRLSGRRVGVRPVYLQR